MQNASPSIGQWTLVLGGIGFACGFLGPIALNPDANQGPLLGIFMTGPGGALLGALLGFAFKWLPVAPQKKWLTLIGTGVIGGVTILLFCFPGPKTLGYVLDSHVASCTPPADHIDDAVEYWHKRIAAAPWGKVRAGWQQDTKRMLRDEGVVLELNTTRFNGSECNSYQADLGVLYMAAGLGSSSGSSSWPPTDLQNFLGLGLVDPLPGRYKALMD
jgi:hypothetical protein